jgi:NAD-dependent dihydropyrimidine dehydrogenase PreA subunit
MKEYKMAKERLVPSIDYKLCMACMVCITACPFSCLEAERKGIDAYGKAYPLLARPESCTGCGICAAACPIEVIKMVS